MAEEKKTTETDIFKQQQATIELLQDVLMKGSSGSSGSTQPVYVTQQAPKEEPAPPNYALYIGLAIMAWFFFRKKR